MTSIEATIEPSSQVRRQHAAVLWLLLATLLWGFSFAWNKAAGDAINRAAGVGSGALLGPVLLLAMRFTLAAVVFAAVFPSSLSGWTPKGTRRAGLIGLLMCCGMVLQVLGLDRTSEAVNAFLTSLTIVFVPLTMTLALRQPPAGKIWAAVVIATVGVFLLSGGEQVHPEQLAANRVGVALGLCCSVAFTFHIILLNRIVPKETPERIGLGSFLVLGILCLLLVLVLPGGAVTLRPEVMARVLAERDVWLNLSMLIVFCTVGAFALMNTYQPRIDPTRAALVYLMEPIFAAGFAYLWSGSTVTLLAMAGAGLIFGANALVEARSRRRPRDNGNGPGSDAGPKMDD